MADNNAFSQFNFEFDPSLDLDFVEFGRPQDQADDELPLAQQQEIPLFPDATPRNQYEPLNPDEVPEIPNSMKQGTAEYAARPAEDRTRELFAYMRPHRLMLLGILESCAGPTDVEALDDVVEQLRKRKFSVYSTSNLCSMLEQAGALQRVLEDGTPYDQYEPAPAIVVIDGEEYYEPTDAPAVHWLVTPEGTMMVDENDPMDRMRTLMAREPGMEPFYKQVLLLCADGGKTMADLSAAVDANPAIAEPRRFFVQHFVEGIERNEGLAWGDNRWNITETGQRFLDELLAGVTPAEQFAPTARSTPHSGRVPTETQGVNW